MANATRPVVEIPFSGAVAKRKRSDREDVLKVMVEDFHEAKRRKPTENELLDPVKSEESSVMEKTDPVVDSKRVCEAIESQFSLEILLKHDELRLINQELAKCQAAMEQLRRCHLIPYPNALGTSDSMSNISNGTGPALRQGNNVPQWAPPYGVTDGPYSKHYSKWLIPDFNFDGARDDWHPYSDGSRAGKSIMEGRSTRNSIGDGTMSSSKSRSQRGSTSQKLQALSSGYPQAKEKAGPCILKRGDGQMVKLVCIDCQRENFSSTQGFINHCRIAHKREFKSHEEAAITSGQPIELDKTGGIVGEEKIQSGDGLVHPLITSAPTDRAAYVALLSRIDASLALFEQGRLPGVTTIPTSATSTPMRPDSFNHNFVPSPDTPHLSNFMRSRGFGGNLTDMISEAKTPIDFEELSSQDEESDDGDSQPQRLPGGLDGNDSPRPIMRMPARAAMSSAPFGRPGSSKGTKPGISPRMSYAAPVINSAGAGNHVKPSPLMVNSHRDDFDNQRDADGDIDLVGPSFVDLSPNTVASNNAPSLVSDDGEYDEGDDAESVSSEPEEDGSDVAEIEFIDGEVEKVVPRTVLRNRSGSGGDNMRMKKEDKHVTFVSPVKETKAKERRARK
jgi:ADA HAT complex component 1